MLWREGPSPAASSTNVCCGEGQSVVATAQQKPASSRAAATAMIEYTLRHQRIGQL